MQSIHGFPVLSAILADPKPAIRMAELPGSDVHQGRISLVDNDVVDDEIVRFIEFGETLPAGALVCRFVYPAVSRTEIKMSWLARYGRNCACIAAIWAHLAPQNLSASLLARETHQQQRCSDCDPAITGKGKERTMQRIHPEN